MKEQIKQWFPFLSEASSVWIDLNIIVPPPSNENFGQYFGFPPGFSNQMPPRPEPFFGYPEPAFPMNYPYPPNMFPPHQPQGGRIFPENNSVNNKPNGAPDTFPIKNVPINQGRNYQLPNINPQQYPGQNPQQYFNFPQQHQPQGMPMPMPNRNQQAMPQPSQFDRAPPNQQPHGLPTNRPQSNQFNQQVPFFPNPFPNQPSSIKIQEGSMPISQPQRPQQAQQPQFQNSQAQQGPKPVQLQNPQPQPYHQVQMQNITNQASKPPNQPHSIQIQTQKQNVQPQNPIISVQNPQSQNQPGLTQNQPGLTQNPTTQLQPPNGAFDHQSSRPIVPQQKAQNVPIHTQQPLVRPQPLQIILPIPTQDQTKIQQLQQNALSRPIVTPVLQTANQPTTFEIPQPSQNSSAYKSIQPRLQPPPPLQRPASPNEAQKHIDNISLSFQALPTSQATSIKISPNVPLPISGQNNNPSSLNTKIIRETGPRDLLKAPDVKKPMFSFKSSVPIPDMKPVVGGPATLTIKPPIVKPNFSFNKTLIEERNEQLQKRSLSAFNSGKTTDVISLEDDRLKQRLVSSQIKKIKFFWRGTNFNYPYTFKRKYHSAYRDSGEKYFTEIVDLSKKVIQPNMNFEPRF